MAEEQFDLQLGTPHHVAYVVDDIEATVDLMVKGLGAGPFFVIEKVPLTDVVSQEEPAEFTHNSAFGCCGNGVIELIEPISLAPERVEKAFSGAPRVQHVAYVVDPASVDDVRASLEQRGLSQYLSSQFGGVETTLHTAREVLDHDIEIHGDNDGLRGFFGMVRESAEGWDGDEPLRPLEV